MKIRERRRFVEFYVASALHITRRATRKTAEPEPTEAGPTTADDDLGEGTVPTSATLAVSGEGRDVAMVNESGRFAVPGTIPLGRYAIHASFPGAGDMVCGRATLTTSEPRTVHTDAAFTSCEVR